MSTTDTQLPPSRSSTSSEEAVRPAAGPKPEFSAPPSSTRMERRGSRLWVIVVILLVLAGGAAATWFYVRPSEEAADIRLYEVTRRSFPIVLEEKGELKATNSADVKAEVEGRATIISIVDEGTHVEKGDLLVELASDEIEERIETLQIQVASSEAALKKAQTDLEILRDENASEIRKAKLALELARQDLDKYQEGDAFEMRKDAELAKEQAEFELNRAEEYLKDSEQLFKQGFITQIERDNDRFTKYKAENELTKAKISHEVLEKYTIPMDLAEKKSAVDEAEAELLRTQKAAEASEAQALADVKAKTDQLEIERNKLTKAKDQKNKTKIYAPASGLVVYFKEGWWERDSRIKTGAQVHERQTLIELPDTSSMKVVIQVHEAQIERIKPGLPAVITVEGMAGREFKGKVTKIAALADSAHRWINPNLKQFETDVQIEGEVSDLKPGATGRVRIFITELKDVVAVPVQAVFSKGGRYFVFVQENGQANVVEVEVGQSSNEFIEIKSGLEPGQQVRLAVDDDLKRELPEAPDKNGDDNAAEAQAQGEQAAT